MRKCRDPEFDRRDLAFVHACKKCARAFKCSFKSSPEGPESVCRQLIEGGTYHCESCIRHKIGGQCHFECVFFREKKAEEPERRTIVPMTPELDAKFRNSFVPNECWLHKAQRVGTDVSREERS